MTKHTRILSILLTLSILALLAGCQIPETLPAPTRVPTATAQASPTPARPPAVDHLLISQVLGGVKGNNNQEFIELYNPADDPVDLQGLSLWYRLTDKQDPVRIARWTQSVLIPAHGHFLLVRAEQDVGTRPDGSFDQAINLTKGGLALQDSQGNRVDAVGWGEKAPASFTEGRPAPALTNGQVLMRLPGGDAGHGQDTDDNASDFILADPAPRNTAAAPAPPISQRLIITADAPESVEPGSEFAYTFTMANETGQTVHDLKAVIHPPKLLKIGPLPEGTAREDGALVWRVEMLADGESVSATVPVTAPYTYADARLQSYQVTAADWPHAASGPIVVTRIEGGVIPIATARTLQGAQLTVEGVATMYTGGFYAGSGNVKFYVQDETGGIQVQVFDGQGSVSVHIGDRVRVKGTIGAYRGAIQIVPDVVPDDVEILQKARPDNLPQPQKVSIAEALQDETLLGRLIQVEGKVVRSEEFTYSYGIDLADDEGRILPLYIDKLTRINPEAIEEGQFYRATGILEVRDGKVQLYPRVQSDLAQVFPPELRVTAEAPISVAPGGVITYTASVFNHTPDPMTHIVITAPVPPGTTVQAISEGGVVDGDQVIWTLAELGPDGGRADVWFSVQAPAAGEDVAFPGFQATADQWPEPATSPALLTFLNDTVPIWAIQGPGDRSPYALKWVEVEGTVTGSFPHLPGFFIQTPPGEEDDDDATSEGLFINVEALDEFPDVMPGDVVRIYGQVREKSRQTQLNVEDEEDIEIVAENALLPDAVPLDPPRDRHEANAYYERVEGMLVEVDAPAVAVSPTSKYGEYVIVLAKHGVDRLWRRQHDQNGIAIMVDDGSSERFLTREGLSYVVYTGDQVTDVVGPLAYTYDNYKIEPIQTPQVAAGDHALPAFPPLEPGQFAIMTWNAENVFDAKPPNPHDPPLPSPAEYHLALKKMADTIRRAGYPTIVALQEIENIQVLEDLAHEDAILEFAYQPALIEGFDDRGIDVGYLIRGDAEIVDVKQYDAPEGLTSRPPLVVRVKVDAGGEDIPLYVINNHFSSMAGGIEITEPRRIAQAQWNIHILRDILLKEEPDARVAIVGDLNAFFDSPPVQTLRDAGLEHVLDAMPPDQRYNYIFQGESQVLDHILVTPNLFQLMDDVRILHVNADFPPPRPDDASAERKSDHDPIITIFHTP